MERRPSGVCLRSPCPSLGATGSAASSWSCASQGCFSAVATSTRFRGSNCSMRSSRSSARGSASGNLTAQGTRCGVRRGGWGSGRLRGMFAARRLWVTAAWPQAHQKERQVSTVSMVSTVGQLSDANVAGGRAEGLEDGRGVTLSHSSWLHHHHWPCTGAHAPHSHRTSCCGRLRMYARALLLVMNVRSSSLGGPSVRTMSLSWST